MKLYHVSRDLNFKENFVPRIPTSAMAREDSTIPRICFSERLEGALTAMQYSIINEENIDTLFFRVYEYEVKDSDCIYGWEELYKKKYVPDVFVTKETWVTNDIKFKSEDSYIIGVYNFKVKEETLVPVNTFYEEYKSYGNNWNLYMEKTGKKFAFIYSIQQIDYIKISDDLRELTEIARETYRLPQEILDKSLFKSYISNSIIIYKDGQLVSLISDKDILLKEMKEFELEKSL